MVPQTLRAPFPIGPAPIGALAAFLRSSAPAFRLPHASRMVAATMLAFASTACGDSSTPPVAEPFDLRLAIQQVYPPQTFLLMDGPAIECGVDITATATGSGEASWEGATFYWFAGPERIEPIDSMRVSGTSVRASWKTPTIVGNAGASEAAWDFSGRAPFEAELHFRYRVAGEAASRTSALRFPCGPGIPPGGAERPVVEVLELRGAESGEVEPGDTLHVRYAASSAFGLWITGAIVEDAFAFQVGFFDGMEMGAEHEVRLIVPTGGALDALVDLDVYAVDGILQSTRTRIGSELRLVDRTPPAIVTSAPVAPQYAVGEKIVISVAATDNNALRWLVYEFGAPIGLVDSVRAAAEVPATTWTIPLTVRPEWIGSTTLTVRVRDAAGLSTEPIDLAPGGVTFVPVPALRER